MLIIFSSLNKGDKMIYVSMTQSIHIHTLNLINFFMKTKLNELDELFQLMNDQSSTDLS